MRTRDLASVIIPVYRGQRTLPSVLAALAPQARGHAEIEVILVDSTGDGSAEVLAREHPWLRVVGLPGRTLPGAARNTGARLARGRELVFLDADSVPALDWLPRLRAAARAEGCVAVAGVVANGTPADAIGTTSYLLEFSELMPGRRGEPNHGASCNLLVNRDAFDASGGFPEDLWPGEDTVLTFEWAASGRLAFARDAIVSHLNRDSLTELMRHQHRLGRSFAAVCDRVEFEHGQFSRWPLLPAAPALHLAALALRLHGQRAAAVRAAQVSPILLLGLAAWTAGLAAERARRDALPI